MKNFANYLRTVEKISESDIDKFISIFSKKKCKRNEVLINSNQICDKLFYIESGALRAFYIDEKGIEKTRLISFENQFCSNWASFHNLSHNSEIIQSLENSEVYYTTHSDFYDLVNSSFELHKIYSKILEIFHTYQIKRFAFICNYSLQKRIEKLEKYFPNLKNRTTNRVLASFLHTTPEHCSFLKSSLSRLTSYIILSHLNCMESEFFILI